MCTLFIYRSENTEWPVFIANNRDEYFTRSFKEPHTHWVNNSNIFAGKDLLKGGSWLGINKSGLCVSILNRNSMVIKKDNLESRGNIVLNALKYNNARDALNNIKKSFKRNTKFFNLIILDYKNAFWIKYDYAQLKVSNIPYGYSIIDN